MNKKHLFFAVLFLAALSFCFVGCENPDSESGISIEKPTTPEAPTLVATGGATDVEYSSVTLWGRINTDTLWAFPNIKWGIEYSTSKEEMQSHKGKKVFCTTDLVGENTDEYSVAFTELTGGKMLYYNAYLLINDMKYIYGEVDSVHLDVKLTVKSNNAYGTVTGSGTYDHGAEATITATPNRRVYFVKWNDENTDNPRVVTVTSDMTYTATFVAVPNGSENGYEWVDLGLPSGLKWATCNVGATKPEEYGDYYAWGETSPQTTYNWNTYKWATATWDATYKLWDLARLTKYNTDSSYGTVDNKIVLELADDAAAVNWGGAWRMPTDAEWTELRENCTWTWTSDYNGTGVKGRIVTSNINGNSIFLPAAGHRYNDGLFYAGNYGYYWSSSLVGAGCAWRVVFDSDDVDRCLQNRHNGYSVRPVLGE